MKKRVLTIVAIVAFLASVLVAFSSVAYDLKNIFLTRDEWESFESSMNLVLPSLENIKQASIQDEVGYQMYRRDILSREIIESMSSAGGTEASKLIEWSKRRSREIEERSGGIAPPSP